MEFDGNSLIQTKDKFNSIKYNDYIVAAEADKNGQFLACVVGYDWSQGLWGLEKSERSKIYVHAFEPQDFT